MKRLTVCMKKDKSVLDQIADALDVKRRFPPGYFNKWVFRAVFLFMGALALFLIVSEGYFSGVRNVAYVECPKDAIGGVCENPLYKEDGLYYLYEECEPPEICSYEFLLPGQALGRKPGVLFRWFDELFILSLLFGFMLNHILYQYRSGLK